MKFLNDVRFDALGYLVVAEIKNEFYIIFRDTMKKGVSLDSGPVI